MVSALSNSKGKTKAECELADDLLDSEEIIAKVKEFLEEGCKCSQGVKGGYCSQQFQKEVVLSNLNNCLELSHGELDLIILANIQAFTRIDVIGGKMKAKCALQFSLPKPSDLQKKCS